MTVHCQFQSIEMHWWQSRWQIWSVSNSGDCILPPWELFAMPSFLSHGQFCSLVDYIWRPAGLRIQLNYISFSYISERKQLLADILPKTVCFLPISICMSTSQQQCDANMLCPDMCQTTELTGLKRGYIRGSSHTLSMNCLHCLCVYVVSCHTIISSSKIHNVLHPSSAIQALLSF